MTRFWFGLVLELYFDVEPVHTVIHHVAVAFAAGSGTLLLNSNINLLQANHQT